MHLSAERPPAAPRTDCRMLFAECCTTRPGDLSRNIIGYHALPISGDQNLWQADAAQLFHLPLNQRHSFIQKFRFVGAHAGAAAAGKNDAGGHCAKRFVIVHGEIPCFVSGIPNSCRKVDFSSVVTQVAAAPSNCSRPADPGMVLRARSCKAFRMLIRQQRRLQSQPELPLAMRPPGRRHVRDRER